MPITEFLKRNAELYGDEIALVEIAPQMLEKAKVTWKEYALIQPNTEESGRQEMTWKEFDKAANRFAFLFGMPAKVGNSSVFAGSALEVMKTPYLGKMGHIAIRTNYIERAVNYMTTVLGVEFNEESAKRDAKGALKAIYLQEEIAGFAVHLVQK